MKLSLVGMNPNCCRRNLLFSRISVATILARNMRALTFLVSICVATNIDSAGTSSGINAARNKLNEYIQHYETLDYDPNLIQHNRHRRSELSSYINLEFQSHGKTFRLKLQRDTSVFTRDVKFVSDDENLSVASHQSHLYSGFLTDDPTSHAYGSIIDGIFDGKIHSKDGIFYVERSSKYQNQLRNAFDSVHSIIYNSEDVVDPHINERSGHVPGCGVTDQFSHARWTNSDGHEESKKLNSDVDASEYKLSDARTLRTLVNRIIRLLAVFVRGRRIVKWNLWKTKTILRPRTNTANSRIILFTSVRSVQLVVDVAS